VNVRRRAPVIIGFLTEPSTDRDLSESRMTRVVRALGVSRAVSYSIFARGFQTLAGPVTVVFIARYSSPGEQGFYYAFASILAMQSFFELGLFNVIVNVAAHEWAATVSPADGAARRAFTRLGSLARFILRWYAAVALLFFLAVSVAGTLFLSRSGSGIRWLAPWLVAVALTALQLVCTPFNSLLEGCNRVAAVNRFLFVQSAISALALWAVMPAAGSLWALTASAAARLASNVVFLAGINGGFLRDLFDAGAHGGGGEAGIDWRTELWPLQWRIALQGAVSWFHSSLFVPVLFYYRGPEVAGRFGMTWSVILVFQTAAYAWVQTRIPEMGMLVARRDTESLDRLWHRSVTLSVAVLVAAAAAFDVALLLLGRFAPEIAARLLDPATTSMLFAGRIAFQVVLGIAAYVRAHKIEPFAPMMVSVSLLYGVFAWLTGWRVGAIGQAAAYLAVSAVVALPWSLLILRRARRERDAVWRSLEPAAAVTALEGR
jgi:hypothetical protein